MIIRIRGCTKIIGSVEVCSSSSKNHRRVGGKKEQFRSFAAVAVIRGLIWVFGGLGQDLLVLERNETDDPKWNESHWSCHFQKTKKEEKTYFFFSFVSCYQEAKSWGTSC